MSDLPEHEWYRVRETGPGTWLIRDRITGVESFAESVLELPEWPEEGE
ncbi:hypothetical protein AB0J81_13775 [Streptomyces bobili]